MHSNDCWGTPPLFFANLESIFGKFYLDAATDASNPLGTPRILTKDDIAHGLIADWGPGLTFINPPYSDSSRWAYKIYTEVEKSVSIVALAPLNWMANKKSGPYMASAKVIAPVGRLAFKPPPGSSRVQGSYGNQDVCLYIWSDLSDNQLHALRGLTGKDLFRRIPR